MPGKFPPPLRPQRCCLPADSQIQAEDGRTSFDSTHSVSTKKSSLDLTQRLEKKLATFNASNNIFKRWIFELLCWATSAVCLSAVVAIYSRVNGKNQSPQAEVLLSWVNVLGKIAAAALIVPTSEALGQLKWNWFHESRAMWDFEIFDKASRGPWGAIMLLFRTKGRSLAAFGAVLILLLLAIDTFLQQVVDYPERWQRSITPGVIPRVVKYKPYSPPQFFQHEEQLMFQAELRPLVQGFLYSNGSEPYPFGNGTRPDIPLICPTSNCTWPEYETLAVCSRCEEVSASLDVTQTCLNTTIDWSPDWTGPLASVPYLQGNVCGYFLNASSDTPILLSGYVAGNGGSNVTSGQALLVRTVPLTDYDTKEPLYGGGSVRFKTVRNPILDGLIASTTNGVSGVYQSEPPDIHECILSWCVQTIRSAYSWGVYEETITSEFWDTSSDPTPWPWRVWESKTGLTLDYESDVALNLSASGPTYGLDNSTLQEIVTLFDDIFPSFYAANSTTAVPLLRYKNYPNGPWTRTLDFNPWLAPNNITQHMRRLAWSMTNVMRSSSSKEMFSGNAYTIDTYVSVKWEWLIFPFVLLLLSLAFLVSTMVKTSKDTTTGVWKTSAMPTLIYGLPEGTREKFSANPSWGGLHGDTRRVRIRLLPNSGWRVSGQTILRSPSLPARENQPPPGWI
ncbi:hypothetical protein E8E12_006608 [Didymella heteroderae]|uniref:DUF3176 domain containing protein n=1 Tax=Didymella heteroderae TaxID=1769908 RepID=A0A9P5C376_9PLEO|nr:hypothetical protein E8E12_006608 [Didymella heteroderae]